MQHAVFRKILAVLFGLVLAATGLWASAAEEGEPAAAMEKEMVMDPTTGQMVTAPEYGGTFTHATKGDYPVADTWFQHGPGALLAPVVEKLGIADWAIPRDQDSLNSTGPVLGIPLRGQLAERIPLRGQLAESWEQPDPLTLIFHIRQGVHWHDKAPMNGRELDASDIEYNLHRVTALGSGFTEPSPTGSIKGLPIESIAATDKWTVVVKLKEPSLGALMWLAIGQTGTILPPEVIKQHGDVRDWRNLVGTGPYMLTDRVEGSSITYEKNPDYWGHDEKYPENRLPYTDSLRTLVMPETATILAALRSRQLDYTGAIGASSITSLDQADSLKRTNPEIVQWPVFGRSETALGFDAVNPPFDDLRVRKAMQMAIDPETMNNAYFKGLGVATPHGWVRRPGYNIPFAEWPEEVKKGYMYDPEGAEALLDAAGYPRGSDGIRFKTKMTHYQPVDINPMQAEVEYWREIGVDVEIEVVDAPTLVDRIKNHTYEGMITSNLAVDWCPPCAVDQSYSTSPWNRPGIKDSVFDALADAADAAATLEEQQRLVGEADMYAIERHWYLWGPMAPFILAHQPWVKGYNGEFDLGAVNYGLIYARLWIDRAMKEEMGY